MDGIKIISSDDHVFEPPDLWTSRLGDKYGDRTPHVARLEDGYDWWVSGDRSMLPMSSGGTQPGVRQDAPDRLRIEDVFENVRLGGYIPDERIKDMDTDGVEVSIIYPTMGFQLFRYPGDSEFVTDCFRAYNDWVAEFCGAHPKRLKGIAMVNLDDVEEGVGELERCARLGYAGAMIAEHPAEDRAYNSPEYEPLWAAAQDLDMPLSLHTSTVRGHINSPSFGTPAHQANPDHFTRMSLAHMIFTGVFERYPNLQVGSVEHGLSWIPNFLDRIDFTYQQRPQRDNWHRFKEAMLPSHYFHRNVFLSFQEDSLGIKMRDITGVDKLQWGSDYPHQEGTWPYSRKILDEILTDCTEEEKAMIVRGNAAKVYHLE